VASIFKPAGKSKYVIFYHDEDGKRHKKTGAADKQITERIARDIENRTALLREGIINTALRVLDLSLLGRSRGIREFGDSLRQLGDGVCLQSAEGRARPRGQASRHEPPDRDTHRCPDR